MIFFISQIAIVILVLILWLRSSFKKNNKMPWTKISSVATDIAHLLKTQPERWGPAMYSGLTNNNLSTTTKSISDDIFCYYSPDCDIRHIISVRLIEPFTYKCCRNFSWTVTVQERNKDESFTLNRRDSNYIARIVNKQIKQNKKQENKKVIDTTKNARLEAETTLRDLINA